MNTFTKEYTIKPNHELRIQLASENATVGLRNGSAEIFGYALETRKPYVLAAGCRCAIFSFNGALIEVIGETEWCYTEENVFMKLYLNIHLVMEECRCFEETAATSSSTSTNAHGPRLMLAGGTDVGKSTICRILCNYAVRQSRCPIYVDLDIGQGSVSLPGTLSAVHVKKQIDPTELFANHSAIVYNFGHVSPSADMSLYDETVKALARRVKALDLTNVSGTIINTCGWIKAEGYAMQIKAAENFEVDVIVVIDNERLFVDLQRDLPAFVKITHLPKSTATEERSRDNRIQSRQSAIVKHFYGTPATRTAPVTFTVSYQQVADEQQFIILRIRSTSSRVEAVRLPLSESLLNHVLAFLPASIDLDQFMAMPIREVVGFAVVSSVDMDAKTITFVSDCPPPLPARFAIFSEVMVQ
jgi:polyribonucleotide 5'-hydroxyl-kinase